MPSFSIKSKTRLKTANEDLQILFNEVIKHYDCVVLCGHRTKQEQEIAFKNKHSKVHFPHSKHNTMPSNAVDIVPYPVDWNNKNRFYEFAGFVKGVASQLGIQLKWGGDFKHFFDAPHFQTG